MKRLYAALMSIALGCAVLVASPTSSIATTPVPARLLTPCPNVSGALCGTLSLPLDRTHKVPGRIGIRIELHPRTDRSLPSLGTIVAVQGGPGYDTRGYRDSYLGLFGPMMRRHRLLMIDLRGTGSSDAINCPALQSYKGDYVQNAGACGRQLGATAVDYGTRDAADDLADVLDALGIDRVDLYGDSYGTFFGQVFAVRHPDRLKTLVLDSAYPVEGPDPWYRDTNRAIRAGFRRACRRDLGCAAVGGDPIARLGELANILRVHPIVGTARNADGVLRHVTVDVGALITFAAGAASSFDEYRELDPAVRAYLGSAHDPVPLLRLAAENLYFGGAGNYHGFSEGLYLATNCNDIPLPFDRNAKVATRRAEYAAGIADLHAHHADAFAPFTVNDWLSAPLSGVQPYDSCMLWPRPARHNPPLPASPTYPNTPVLVLSGDLDSLTSPEGAHQVADEFPNATFVDVHNMNHIAALGDYGRCASDIVVRFVRSGGNAGDTSCAADYNEQRVVDKFPMRAAGLGRMSPGRRTALVAANSVADVIARWWVMYGYHGVGLRGGGFDTTGYVHAGFTLHGIRWVNDAAVSGTVTWDQTDGSIRADVTVNGTGVAPGHLILRWNDHAPHATATAHGSVGGRAVHLSFPAP